MKQDETLGYMNIECNMNSQRSLVYAKFSWIIIINWTLNQ